MKSSLINRLKKMRGKIVKKRKKGAHYYRPLNLDDLPKNTTPTQINNNANQTSKSSTQISKTGNRNKITMPPIVIYGKTKNQTELIRDIKAITTGEFPVKHTNYTTIIFVENKADHEKILNNIKSGKMPFHTYTAREDKFHVFVLRNFAEDIKVEYIRENLEEEQEIVARDIFPMKTKERPLYLIVTDPVMTLDYLNKNDMFARNKFTNFKQTQVYINPKKYY
ncbi:unnamed protein product [Psylliodes chrysocephalus]|uniref:Uncharacterized protein n=1 Tax=Psylliodes chrysocephalus TaxID=3402493 RepID=A0A9P0CQN9_9CUCU|nr:unnamed protein product [Psylliodes chrysocephala]